MSTSPEAEPDLANPTGRESYSQSRSPRVLVIDDDRLQRLVISRCVQKLGWSADEASSLGDARMRLESGRYYAVVIDLCLGEEDGLAVLRTVRELAPEVVVTFVSGADDRILAACFRVARSMGLRVAGTLRKPIKPDSLQALLISQPSRVTLEASEFTPPTAEQFAQALEHGEIFAEFQPKIDLRSRRLIGVEALARWHSPQFGYIPPDLFVPIAERSGLINILTDMMLSQAISLCLECRNIQPDFSIAINISPLLLSNEGFVEDIDQKLIEGNLPHAALVVEITESTMLLNPALATEMLTRLSIKGVKASIDDFGTGHSSLISLLRSPFSELKLDRSFVEASQTDGEAWKIITAVLLMAHELGMRVVAEGVESRRIGERLREAGCDVAQGWLYGRSMGKRKLLNLIRETRQIEARPLPSEMTPEEARMRTVQFRQLAEAASARDIRDALLKQAKRYESMAPEQSTPAWDC